MEQKDYDELLDKYNAVLNLVHKQQETIVEVKKLVEGYSF